MIPVRPDQHRAAWSPAPYVPLATLEAGGVREIALAVRLAKRLPSPRRRGVLIAGGAS